MTFIHCLSCFYLTRLGISTWCWCLQQPRVAMWLLCSRDALICINVCIQKRVQLVKGIIGYQITITSNVMGGVFLSCFLVPGLAMYIGLLLPLVLTLIHNVIVYVMVIHRLRTAKNEPRSCQVTRRLVSAILINALTVVIWCFGFLSVLSSSLIFSVVFCMMNCCQVRSFTYQRKTIFSLSVILCYEWSILNHTAVFNMKSEHYFMVRGNV